MLGNSYEEHPSDSGIGRRARLEEAMGRISLMGKGHGSPSSKRPAAAAELRRGHFAVYVGTEEKRFLVPVSYLKSPSFQALLHQAEEVFGLDQPPGGLRLPCSEPTFLSVVSQLGGS